MQIKPDILEYLDKRNVSYELANTTKGIVNKVDVIYQTRINQDRLKSKKIDLSVYNIDSDVLKVMKNDAIIMHPLPRSVEISHEVDSDHRAKYFRQSENGIYVRMALLTMLFDN
jgi:aspartate carbamoyltransferase catalytic subunit